MKAVSGHTTELRSRKDFDKNFLLSVCTTYTEAYRSCLFLTIDWPRDIACICQIKYSLVSSPILLLKPIFGLLHIFILIFPHFFSLRCSATLLEKVIILKVVLLS